MRGVLAALVGMAMLAGCATTVSGTGRELSAAPSTRSSSAPPSATRFPSSAPPSTTRPAPPSRSRRVPIDNLHVGDCIDPAPTGSGSVYTMPVVSCAQAHDQEVFVSRNLSPAPWPGDAALDARTEKLCTTEFARFIGIAIDESLLDFDYYFPDKESWQGGDHLVLCLAFDPEGKTVGTLRAARR
ncbi:MAG TPA: septum formation family protein [Jatrophihabitantaceae bacterium]|nr:septum formation family protein [Jatrophihabitantaceae bacterium]